MKIRVYFCKEPDIEIIIKSNKIGRQALATIYDLVWECEFKNILNVGRVWLKFKDENKPFGIPLRDKRTHSKISPGSKQSKKKGSQKKNRKHKALILMSRNHT